MPKPTLAINPTRRPPEQLQIVIADTDRNTLDFEARQQRIHPAASRVTLLSEQIPASFIAFDLLALDDADLTEEPRSNAGEAIERAFAHAASPVHITPATWDMATARRWFVQFEGGRTGRADRQGSGPDPVQWSSVDDRAVRSGQYVRVRRGHPQALPDAVRAVGEVGEAG